MINSQNLINKLKRIFTDIEKLLYRTMDRDYSGEFDENIKYADTAEERLLKVEIYKLLDKLDDVRCQVEYLN